MSTLKKDIKMDTLKAILSKKPDIVEVKKKQKMEINTLRKKGIRKVGQAREMIPTQHKRLRTNFD